MHTHTYRNTKNTPQKSSAVVTEATRGTRKAEDSKELLSLSAEFTGRWRGLIC